MSGVKFPLRLCSLGACDVKIRVECLLFGVGLLAFGVRYTWFGVGNLEFEVWGWGFEV